MKNLTHFALLPALVLLVGCSIANIQQGNLASRLELTFRDQDTECPVRENEARGDFALEFQARAINGDVFIRKSTDRNVDYRIETSTGLQYDDIKIPNARLSSLGDPRDTPSYFRISEGEARVFMLYVKTMYPRQKGHYRLALLNFGTNSVEYVGGIEAFRTDTLLINDRDFN